MAGFVVYALLLGALGRSKKLVSSEEFQTGGQRLSPRTIFFMVTALWSSSLIVVEIDTAYTSGVGAVWYGVSVVVMSLLVSLLMPWFRSYHYVSNSGLLGDRLGRGVRRFSGIVIGATFPIFALSNALAAGAFFHVLFHCSLWLSLSLTTCALIVYIQYAGMLSLARTQGLNFFVIVVGMVCAAVSLEHIPNHLSGAIPPSFWHLGGVGHGMIWVWFGMNCLNVFSAQAEIQAVAAAKDLRSAQRAVWWSTLVLLAMIALSTAIGVKTRMILHRAKVNGLTAFADVVVHHDPTWGVVVIGLSVWALALTWCGPLLFSGAISLGQDVWSGRNVRRWTRWALVVEGGLMVAYGVWRPGEVAWWRVFGLTLRNGAVVGPTLSLFLWDDVPGGVALGAMLSGVAIGLGLNACTGFSATHFVGHINPMWSAAATTFGILGVWRLVSIGRWVSAALSILLALGTAGWLIGHQSGGLTGVLILCVSLALLAGSWALSRNRASYRKSPEVQPISPVDDC